jgi:Domain of unknown function (DUF4349)
MRQCWKKIAAVCFLVFLGLWTAGIIRAAFMPFPALPVWEVSPLSSPDYSSRLAVANNLHELGLTQTPLPAMLDRPEVERIRVYEKSAQLAAGTATFDDDEARIRAALASRHALVFNERNGGIAPERRLTLEIGVSPDRFDALVGQLRQVGHLESVSVQQRDRTTEFRQLHAQRQALKKYLESVLKLRPAGNPSIDAALKLEEKIQDIEKDLQKLGVQLGDLLGKESFYHAQVTLVEYQPGAGLHRTHTLAGRLGFAFLWALAWWLAVALGAGVLAATYLSIQTLRPRRSAAGNTRP